MKQHVTGRKKQGQAGRSLVGEDTGSRANKTERRAGVKGKAS